MKKFLLVFLTLATVYTVSAQSPSQDSLKQYTGGYKFAEGPVTEVTVNFDNGALSISSAMGSSELRKAGTDVFEIVAYGGTATFRRNADGKVAGIQIVVGSRTMEGTKNEVNIRYSMQ